MPEDQLEIRSRRDLREWLRRNHGQTTGLWLVTFKKPSPYVIAMSEIVEELLCWGWIDSRTRKIDAERSAFWIAPRRAGSAWSAVNKAHVLRARASGAMTPAGERLIAEAEASGMWSFLDDVERLEVPQDLADALAAAGATDTWERLPRRVNRGTVAWIKTARQPPTREKRIRDVADRAAAGLRPPPFSR